MLLYHQIIINKKIESKESISVSISPHSPSLLFGNIKIKINMKEKDKWYANFYSNILFCYNKEQNPKINLIFFHKKNNLN